MSDILLAAIITAPAYLIPAVVELKRRGLGASTFFFFYTLLGSWLYSLLLGLNFLPAHRTIAPWIVDVRDIPWYAFSIINITIFLIQSNKKGIPTQPKQALPKSVFRLAVATLLLTLFYIVVSIALKGGLSGWITKSYTRVATDNSLINYLFPLPTFTLVSTVVQYSILRRVALSTQSKTLIYTNCLLQLLIALAAGGRSVLLLYVISLVVAHGKPKIPKWLLYSSLAIAIVSTSGSMIYLRYKNQSAQATFDYSLINVVDASYTGLPFIDHFQLTREFVQEYGFDYGQSYANLITLPIPRSIWEEKPLQVSRVFREAYWGDSSGGIPPGLFGESYLAVGWAGVMFVSLAYGVILRKIGLRYRISSNDSFQVATIATLGSAIGFVLIRGGLDIGVYRVGLIIASLLICQKIAFEKTPHEKTKAQ